MRKADTSDVFLSALAVAGDALAVFGGMMLATWLRFASEWFVVRHAPPEGVYTLYAAGAAVATLVYLLVFRALALFVRPQTGRFPAKIPRLIRGGGIGVLLCAVLAFALQNEVDFSRLVLGIAFFTVTGLVLLERWILFRIEWYLCRHRLPAHHALILGTDEVASRLARTIEREAMLRTKVMGFLRTRDDAADGVPAQRILGGLDRLPALLRAGGVQQVILTDAGLGHERVLDLLLLSERELVTFNMVPDLFRILTSSMDVQSLDDIPLLGVARWPLDIFWNRLLKRLEDIAGACVGLALAGPVMLAVALLTKRSSPGPVFYSQERCGQGGRVFRLYKLRTMRVDAEAGTGPVFTQEQDPRVTPLGAWLRQRNLDELPQLWNVLRGDMSLVGPRPERPHFVEKFKDDINRYMWRHVSKPGMTGWAQVNGLRGNTSIPERIKYDLYYLENWSLTFDFKILARTLGARKNAY